MMKWWKNFTVVERIVFIINIILFIAVFILTQKGYFPSTVGVAFIALISISIILILALMFNRK